MKDSFLFFSAECVNSNCDSAYKIMLIPVSNGEVMPLMTFLFNPEAPFESTTSGMGESDIRFMPSMESVFPEVKEWFSKFSLAVSTSDGYSARALYNSLERLGIDFDPIQYVSAKAVIRKAFPELVSCSMSFLNRKFYGYDIPDEDTDLIARRWLEIMLKGLDNAEEESLRDFVKSHKIRIGEIAPGNFVPTKTISIHHDKFDADSIAVFANEAHPLYGKTVVFTGKLESLKRNEARTAVIQIGGMSPETVTKDTDYLVVGVQDLRIVGEKGLSGKMKKAAQYKEAGKDIEIIDEKDFLEMMKAGVNFG